mgnify:FL=1
MEQARDESLATLPPPISETTPRPYRNDDDDQLLQRYELTLSAQRVVQRQAYELEQEAMRRMEERGATAIPSEHYICEVVQRDTYDQAGFTPLLEMFSEADLIDVYTQERTEQKWVTTPARWDTAKVKAKARRYGIAALDVVERARIEGRPRLKFEVRGA